MELYDTIKAVLRQAGKYVDFLHIKYSLKKEIFFVNVTSNTKGCVSKKVSRTKYCLFFRSLNTYGEHKGCFQKYLTNLILKMSLISLLAFM